MECNTPEQLAKYIRDNGREKICSIFLLNLDPIYLAMIYHELEQERAQRKNHDVEQLHILNRSDWNYTILTLMLRYLGDMDNRNAYTELAQRIGFDAINHVRHDLHALEALMVSASGLLEELPQDSFTRNIQEVGSEIMKRFNITPTSRKVWNRKRMLHTKEPILRLAQIARVLHNTPLLLDTILQIRSREDLFSLLNVEASSTWSSYFRGNLRCRIGAVKSDIMGINLVAPILNIFGNFAQNSEYITAAVSILEDLPPESNKYVKRWVQQGVSPVNAYETQAIIQLSKEYCDAKESRCLNCYLFRQMIVKAEILNRTPALPSVRF